MFLVYIISIIITYSILLLVYIISVLLLVNY